MFDRRSEIEAYSTAQHARHSALHLPDGHIHTASYQQSIKQLERRLKQLANVTIERHFNMVFYFRSRCNNYLMYMGKDKYENEELIRCGLPEDVWFHVDDLSSAHVYLRLKPGETMDDIPEQAIVDCATLVKANSISGCKMKEVYVVYTRWKNLKKTSDMVAGQVSYHRPENVRRIKVVKDNTIVNTLNKTKEERFPDLYKEQQDREREIIHEQKETMKAEVKARKLADQETKKRKEELSYDRIMKEDNMTSNANFKAKATADSTAAEEFEDDFF